MAYLTIEQREILRQLELVHGKPERVKLEFTDAPYGLLWVRWDEERRNLFVKPDGSRLSWALVPEEA